MTTWVSALIWVSVLCQAGLLPAEHGALTLLDCAFAGHDPGPGKPAGDEPVGGGNADQNGRAYDTEDDVTQMIFSALVRQYAEHGAPSSAQKRQGGQAGGLGTGCPRYHLRRFPSGSPRETNRSCTWKPQPEH